MPFPLSSQSLVSSVLFLLISPAKTPFPSFNNTLTLPFNLVKISSLFPITKNPSLLMSELILSSLRLRAANPPFFRPHFCGFCPILFTLLVYLSIYIYTFFCPFHTLLFYFHFD